jgi:tetratricopeptide (TPR) repeat protein
MYLRGSKWSMNKRRVRPNWFRITLLVLMVSGAAYVNKYIVPNQPKLGVPSPTPTRPPEAYITEAEAYFNEGKLLQSIDSYQQAIIVRPDDPTTHVALARVQVWAGQYEEAETSAGSALLLDGNNALAHGVLAWAQDFQGEYLEAQSNIQRALELDNQNALLYAYYVEILVDANLNGVGPVDAIQTAIENSQKAISLNPNLIETHRARGYLLEATGNYAEAIGEYQAAIAINGKIADLHLSLGNNFRNLATYDQAVKEFTAANALNPEDPIPDLYLSRTYATIGEFGKARQYAESAVENDPSDANLHGNFGVMLFSDSYWNEAVVELGYVVNGGVTEDGHQIQSIELTPDSPRIAEYYYTYGIALSTLNQCGDALRIAQLILSRIPADENAVTKANQINERCQQNLDAPSPTATEPAAVSTDVPATEEPVTEATPTP